MDLATFQSRAFTLGGRSNVWQRFTDGGVQRMAISTSLRNVLVMSRRITLRPDLSKALAYYQRWQVESLESQEPRYKRMGFLLLEFSCSCWVRSVDRLPWLLKLHEVIERERSSGSDALVICSALKRLYRQILLYGSKVLTSSSSPDQEIPPPDIYFLFLYGDYDLIHQRMVVRRGHYMKENLLRSQFDVLEPPLDEENVLPLHITRSITDMATEVEKHFISLKSSQMP